MKLCESSREKDILQAAMNREDKKDTSAAAANGSFGREGSRLPSRSFPLKVVCRQ